MPDGTQPAALKRSLRSRWRDAIKDDERLGRDAVLIGLLMADYIKDSGSEPLWVVVDVLLKQSRMSRAALYRAQAELREVGFLDRVESAKPGRAPRWRPTIPAKIPAPRKPEDSHTENRPSQTENPVSHIETRNHTQTSSTPDVEGPNGLDCESQPISREIASTKADQADLRKLARYAINLPPGTVDALWSWMRIGKSLSGRPNTEINRPGAHAANLAKQPTKVAGVTAWHEYFHRHYLSEEQKQGEFQIQTEDDRARDPWAS